MNRTDIGDIDHTKFKPPFLRLVSENNGGCLHDLRISQPNISVIPDAIIHSFEHLLNYNFSKELGYEFSLVGVMGCQTGFYIITSKIASITLDNTLFNVLNKVLEAREVPWCNKHSCGRYLNHNLEGAKNMAKFILDNFSNIDKVF